MSTPTADDLFGIQQALYAYCGGIDTKDPELFRSAFTDDVRGDYGEWAGPFEGLDELALWMDVVHRNLDGSFHRITNPYFIEFDGETARVRSYIHAVLHQVDHPDGETFTVYGIYLNDLRREPEGWRISSKEYVHLIAEGNASVLDAASANQAVEDLRAAAAESDEDERSNG